MHSLFGNYSSNRNGKLYIFLYLLASLAYSLPAFSQGDAFEDDDSAEFASLVLVRNETQQARTFHDAGDEDWFRFAVRADAFYEITIKQVGEAADPELSLYGFDPNSLLRVIDDGADGDDEIYSFRADADGIYYAKLSNWDPQVAGEDITYTLAVFEPVGAFAGPDLEILQQATYLRINQGSEIELTLDVSNLGGQQQDNTAKNVLLQVYLASGMTVVGEMLDGCTVVDINISCELDDIVEQGSSTVVLSVTADSLGRRNVVSTVSSYNDSDHTSLQADDKFSNNTSETQFTIIERANFGLNVRASKSVYEFNEEFAFFVLLETNQVDAELGSVDVYFQVQPPEGDPVYISDLLPSISATAVPLLSNWMPESLPDTEILRFNLPDTVPTGAYTWSLIFNKSGTDVLQQSNHQSRADFTHQLNSD